MDNLNIVFDTNVTELSTVKKGKNELTAYVFTTTNSKGEVVKHTLTGELAVKAYSIDYVSSVNKSSSKVLAVMIANVTNKEAEECGFKNATAFIKAITEKAGLDGNTIGKYRRVGRVFGLVETVTDIDGTERKHYTWKDPIDENVTVTNLTSCLGLLGLPKDLEKVSDEEIETAFKAFVEKYGLDTESPALHLNATLSRLREEISDLKKVIANATSEPIEGEPTSEGVDPEEKTAEGVDPEEKTAEESAQDAKREYAVKALSNLQDYFKGNKKALDYLAKLVDLMNA